MVNNGIQNETQYGNESDQRTSWINQLNQITAW